MFPYFLIIVTLPFIFQVKSYLKANWYTYLGVPFSNNLELKPIIQRMNNKVGKAHYSIKVFLKNPHIPIPYKWMLFSAKVIGQVSYYAPLHLTKKEQEIHRH